jgi:hypothetical protein
MFGEQNVTTGASKLYIPAAAVPTLPLTESAISRTPLAVARLARAERQMIDVLVTHFDDVHASTPSWVAKEPIPEPNPAPVIVRIEPPDETRFGLDPLSTGASKVNTRRRAVPTADWMTTDMPVKGAPANRTCRCDTSGSSYETGEKKIYISPFPSSIHMV